MIAAQLVNQLLSIPPKEEVYLALDEELNEVKKIERLINLEGTFVIQPSQEVFDVLVKK